MKTRIYARLSLLIPLLVWVISLSVLLAAYAFLPDPLTGTETPALVAVVGMLLVFYAFGIIFWIVPYLLLSLFLLLMSFISTEKVLKLVYFLAPILMAAMILLVVMAFAITPPGGALLIEDLTSDLQDSAGTGVLFAVITLAWGYICVGLGFGGYKLLHRFGIIQEEAGTSSEGLTVGG